MPVDMTYMRMLGLAKLLADAALFVPGDDRDAIEEAMQDLSAHYTLSYKRVLNRIEIEPEKHPSRSTKQKCEICSEYVAWIWGPTIGSVGHCKRYCLEHHQQRCSL